MVVYDLEPIEEKLTSSEEASAVPGKETQTIKEKTGTSETVFEKAPEVAKENSYEKILEQAAQAQSQTTTQHTSSVKDDVASISSVDEESRIQKLVNIAIEKGPEHAFRVALELDDMYALDMLHDRLSHQLYQELVTKGLLKGE